MQLTYFQKQQLYEDGYVVVPNVVPKLMVDEAVKAINHSIGSVGSGDGERPQYASELWQSDSIANLFNRTPAISILESLLGEGVFPKQSGAQIALRFPSYTERPKLGGGHLDAMLELVDRVHNFTALVSIYLNDVHTDFAGNFTVWPGSHRAYGEYFRKHGPDILLKEESFKTMHRSPNVPLQEPVQVKGKPGDMIITHYQLVHTAAPNVSPHTRYACFFRIKHHDVENDWRHPLVHMWDHWPGMHDVVKEMEQGES